jgi:hypothetical protein
MQSKTYDTTDELTPKDVEQLFGLPLRSQIDLRQKRKITHIKRRGRIYYQKKWIEAYLQGEMIEAVRR